MHAALAACAAAFLAGAGAQPGCGKFQFEANHVSIDKVPPPPSCEDNPMCPQNPGADCCPTPGADGFLLDCCNPFQCECKYHPECVYQKKEGSCCPAADGKYDDCCSNLRNAVNVPDCKGKTGNVCPDDEGKYDPCCRSQCQTNPGCANLGLNGFCCPTPTGIQLGCCDGDASAAATLLLPVSNGTSPVDTVALAALDQEAEDQRTAHSTSALVALAAAAAVVASLVAVGVSKFSARAAPEGYSTTLMR